MDSLESIILVLVILCILILFKIESNRKIEGFAFLSGAINWLWGAAKTVLKVVILPVVKYIAPASTLAKVLEGAILMLELPVLVPQFIRKSGDKGVEALQKMHNVIAKYTDILRRFGILTYKKARDTANKYFKIVSDTLKGFASKGISTFKKTATDRVNKLTELFQTIIKKLTDLFRRELLKNTSIWMKQTLFQVNNTMIYVKNTIKNTLREAKKHTINLYKQILTDMNNNIIKFTNKLNKRLNLALASTFFKIQPYMIFLSFTLFLLIGGGIFFYFIFSSSEENIDKVNNN